MLDDIDRTWQRCFAEHVRPSRIFAIAMDMTSPTALEMNHLATCADCAAVIASYRLDRRLTAIVKQLMQQSYLEDEPTSKCFDTSEPQMAQLLAYIGKTAQPDTAEAVRTHLVDCSRCRHLYCLIYNAEPVG